MKSSNITTLTGKKIVSPEGIDDNNNIKILALREIKKVFDTLLKFHGQL